MRLTWHIGTRDVRRVRSFFEEYRDNPLVRRRVQKNLKRRAVEVTRPTFWKCMVSCLLTTQQRSGPGSAVSRFVQQQPFPLTYRRCADQRDLERYATRVLAAFGGLRMAPKIGLQVAMNFELLTANWPEVAKALQWMQQHRSAASERRVAEALARLFTGIGPKQSRNLLQLLGLTRFEIPLDSRITKWLNEFGFPVKLSAQALGDPNYYAFVSDGFQALCARSGVFPCILDAAVFVSFDERWEEKDVVW